MSTKHISEIPIEERGALPLNRLATTPRIQRIFHALGISTLGEVCNLTTGDLLRVRGVGVQAHAEIIGLLEACEMPHKLNFPFSIKVEAERIINKAKKLEAMAKALRAAAAVLTAKEK